MNSRKNIAVTILLVVSVSAVTAALTVLLLSNHYSGVQFQNLEGLCRVLIEEKVSNRDALLEVIKENRGANGKVKWKDGDKILESFGYYAADFTDEEWENGRTTAAVCLGASVFIFLAAFIYWHNRECRQIQAITEYLEKVNMGEKGLIFAEGENDYSRLQDEIYKTVTSLYQTRDAALAARNNFADNLYNIAHQLKTPITGIALSAQMIEEKYDSEYARQIQKQVARLTYLEEALLLLARIDAGTLVLKKENLDVFTLLTLAADNLQELFVPSNTAVDIPERGQVEIIADMEWTMEAVMNLFKNCLEHSSADAVIYCTYEQNPLYVQILIWDEGEGFEKEDIPHVFERFYRGKNAAKGGVGIGLALSKAIIEMQNGTISAGNLPEGGAYFEIRIYSH